MLLNQRAMRLSDRFVANSARLGISVATVAGARVVDAGVNAVGGFEAGLALARICMADLGTVSLVPGPAIQVVTDHPMEACLASQYAGWQVQFEKFFAMGSGPMRAHYGKEPLFDTIGFRETANEAVGVLESRKLPGADLIEHLADKLQLPPDRITLWVAPTGSIAGSLQIVARSVETCLHKLHELKYDLATISNGYGVAPMPPIVRNDLRALGWTNDAILYGAEVHLYVDTSDEVLREIGPSVPSNASPEYGRPFREMFEAAGRDFYKLDPMLFAPAKVVFHNQSTGKSHSFGELAPHVMHRSFGSGE